MLGPDVCPLLHLLAISSNRMESKARDVLFSQRSLESLHKDKSPSLKRISILQYLPLKPYWSFTDHWHEYPKT